MKTEPNFAQRVLGGTTKTMTAIGRGARQTIYVAGHVLMLPGAIVATVSRPRKQTQ